MVLLSRYNLSNDFVRPVRYQQQQVSQILENSTKDGMVASNSFDDYLAEEREQFVQQQNVHLFTLQEDEEEFAQVQDMYFVQEEHEAEGVAAGGVGYLVADADADRYDPTLSDSESSEEEAEISSSREFSSFESHGFHRTQSTWPKSSK